MDRVHKALQRAVDAAAPLLMARYCATGVGPVSMFLAGLWANWVVKVDVRQAITIKLERLFGIG